MKFVTYNLYEGSQPRFGFKKNDYIIDIVRASIWIKKDQEDASFLDIPSEDIGDAHHLADIYWYADITKGWHKLFRFKLDS